ncbi:MAG: hypothetical protein HY870_15740 [Chloroflexi bacterium]|nr:hypothetical protein [Chloroflexota bacterium]
MTDAYAKAVMTYAGYGFVIGLPVSALLNHFLPTDGFSLGRFLLLLVLTMIITVVVSIPAIGRLAEKIGGQEAARLRAVPMEAAIVSVEQTGTSKRGEWLYVTLTLDLTLPDGRAQSVTTDGWRIKAIDAPRVQPGQSVGVKFDVIRPAFVFPDVGWIQQI